MERKQGHPSTPIIECLDKQTLFAVRWDYRQEQQGDETVTTFMEERFPVRPTLSEIKTTVFAWINSLCTENILTGFIWNGIQIWLSNENQANYAATHMLLSLNELDAPVTIRGGHDDAPEYITFETNEEFKAFWISARTFIDTTINEAWQKKAAFDFTPYENKLGSL